MAQPKNQDENDDWRARAQTESPLQNQKNPANQTSPSKQATAQTTSQPKPSFGMPKITPARAIKIAFSAGGIALGLIGILVTLAAFFIISGALTQTKLAIEAEIGTIASSLDSVQQNIDLVSASAVYLPPSLNSTADSLDHYSAASLSVAAGLDGLSGAIAPLSSLGIGASVGQNLGAASSLLRSSSSDMKNASTYLHDASDKLTGTSASLSDLSAKIGAAKQGLNDVNTSIDSAFGSINLGVLLLCLALCLLFLMMMAYSIPAAL